MKEKWKIIIIVFLLLPCLWFFKGCSCSNTENTQTGSGNTYTVLFYTGIADKFNVAKQEVEEGGLVREPLNFPTRYYDEETKKSYYLIGWYSDASLENNYLWKFHTDEVHNNLTLYAKWKEIKA